MFLIDDASIQAIQAAHARAGDLAAVVELRERFPGITSNTAALDAVRMVLTMKPDDGTITAQLAALKAERRRAAKPREIVIRWDLVISAPFHAPHRSGAPVTRKTGLASMS